MSRAGTSSPGARLSAVVTLIASHGIRDLAEGELGVDHTLLAHVRAGRQNLSERLATRLEEVAGVSRTWLFTGEGAVFVRGRSPGKDVAAAIERQVELGAVQTLALPVADELETLGRLPTSRVVKHPGKKSKIEWFRYPQRSVAPTQSELKSGFYLALNAETAPKAGGMPGDFVMFVPPQDYLRTIPTDGHRALCLVESDQGIELYAGVEVRHAALSDSDPQSPPDTVLKRYVVTNRPGRARTAIELVISAEDARRIKDALAVAVWLERSL